MVEEVQWERNTWNTVAAWCPWYFFIQKITATTSLLSQVLNWALELLNAFLKHGNSEALNRKTSPQLTFSVIVIQLQSVLICTICTIITLTVTVFHCIGLQQNPTVSIWIASAFHCKINNYIWLEKYLLIIVQPGTSTRLADDCLRE